MSQMVDGPRKTFKASETGGANLRWYISDPTTSPRTVSLCDAATPSVGVNEDAVLAASDLVTLLLSNASGTRKMVAAGAITGGNNVYAAADGEVDSSGTILEGMAFETVTTDQDILEVMATFGEDVDEDWADNETLEFGTGDDAIMMWSTGDASAHALVIGVGDANGALHITDKAARATDWNLTADTHPTVYIHSNTTPATDYVSLGGHDGTTATLDVGGGTTFNIDIAGTTEAIFTAALTTLPGHVIAVEAVANTAGIGITGAADNYVTSVEKTGTIIKTTILIEVDGLNSGGGANDVIGADGAGVAHLGQITAAVNGTIFAGKITCLETPTGGDPNIDLWYTDDATGVEDTDVAAMGNQVQCIDHGDWTIGDLGVLTAFPAATKYLYLTTEDITDATYTAGILLIELYGVAP